MNIDSVSLQNLTQAEEFYKKCSEAYYDGETIISDLEFDRLQEKLAQLGSTVVDSIGTGSSQGKVELPSPMLSLTKVHGGDTLDYDEDEYNKLKNFFKTLRPGTVLESAMKLDGNSINLIYQDGWFKQAVTRGNGVMGEDVTRQAQHIAGVLPQIKNAPGLTEVRGEIVIKQNLFDVKYDKNAPEETKSAQFEGVNSRNFVSGHMNPTRTEIFPEVLKDFNFVAFDVRHHNDTGDFEYSDKDMAHYGFDILWVPHQIDEIKEVYANMLKNRAEYPYPTDGMVVRVSSAAYRKELGEGSRAPKWARAIKFPAVQCVTTIEDIEWTASKDGELHPTAILTPVFIDGSTVSRASLHNAGNVMLKKLWPGATVKIHKGGDIIPHITEVVTEAATEYQLPTEFAKVDTVLQGIHLMLTDAEAVIDTHIKRLSKIFKILEVDGWGKSWAETLAEYGVRTIEDIVTLDWDDMIQKGVIKPGRSTEIKQQAWANLKQIELHKLVNSLQTTDIGSTLSQRLADDFAGLEADYSGMNSNGIKAGKAAFDRLRNLITMVEATGREVVMPSEDDKAMSGEFTYEMTGSPKEFGFAKKSDFTAFAASKGFTHTKLSKDTDYLVTDDMGSSSSKMAKARKYGVKIILYSDVK